MGRLPVIGDREELTIRRQWEHEILPLVWGNRRAYKLLRSVFRCVSEDRLDDVIVATAAGKKRDLAEEERQWWETWYDTLGFARVFKDAEIAVRKPEVSNRAFARWQESQSGLIYVPATTREFYERFMAAVGQDNHWTVANADREGIIWDESAASGYWLKVEIAPDCPRLGTSWNMLQEDVRLLTLTEYAIAWHATKARADQMLDIRTWCWLKTRYKFADGKIGALQVDESDGVLGVHGRWPEVLEGSHSNEGGRAGEVVPNAA